jgi:hypothetical protein
VAVTLTTIFATTLLVGQQIDRIERRLDIVVDRIEARLERKSDSLVDVCQDQVLRGISRQDVG